MEVRMEGDHLVGHVYIQGYSSVLVAGTLVVIRVSSIGRIYQKNLLFLYFFMLKSLLVRSIHMCIYVILF
jgi:hypothetical protein